MASTEDYLRGILQTARLMFEASSQGLIDIRGELDSIEDEDESVLCKTNYVRTLQMIQRELDGFDKFWQKSMKACPDVGTDPDIRELLDLIKRQRAIIEQNYLELAHPVGMLN